ncbi:hypothetical protein CcI49_35215 [Frankia sp. CcI49]|uniref:NAD(P)H-dependent amine dehydrogenase family protein n=1 Tax=Frankia sp. CcI49 TaxID=1745382 RepID=UPI000976DECF|nr:hypothetical protein [Frankia sp. CcI49]ONH51661.1 hypothetical protein CcI49_35215 [Frankia sp. CcI49]
MGREALRGIINHPALELVGVCVNAADKEGRDAAELCGLADPTGVVATRDSTALLALQPDCLSYFGPGPGREKAVVADLVPFLSAGANVVTTSLAGMVYPPAADARSREPLAAAATSGQTSFFATGIEPGLGSDLLPLSLLSACDDVESVRIQEIADYSTYGVEEAMRFAFGFGNPPDQPGILFTGDLLVNEWGAVISQLADALGLRLDGMDTVHEVATVDTDLSTAIGTLHAGEVSGVRFEVRGLLDGRPVIILEHVNRMGAEVAPDWPHGSATDTLVYRVEIEGRPAMRCELTFDQVVGSDHGLIATAMRAVNAIPAVCAAPSGLLSALDLPVIAGRNVVRRVS